MKTDLAKFTLAEVNLAKCFLRGLVSDQRT